MSDVDEAFTAHALELREKYSSLRLSEADTRSYLIDPVLRLLGYSGVEHLRREVPVASTKEFLDYELLIRGEPRAIVEAKALRQPVSDQHAGQCVQYAAVLGVRWCFITNGVEWLLYDAYAKGPLAEKRVASIRLDGDGQSLEQAWAVLSLFTREALERSDPINSLLIERVLLDELQNTESPTITALRRAVFNRFSERVSAGSVVQVARALVQPKATPVPIKADQPLPATSAGTDVQPRPAQRRTTASQAARVTLGALIDAGLLPEGAAIEATVRGVSHAARISEGRIELNGSTYGTPSAASMALRNVVSWNGWVDWRYRGVTLAQLREQLQSRGQDDQSVTEAANPTQ